MGLTNSLNAATSGLATTQAQIDLISQNVANAGSVGYVRRVMNPVQNVAGDRTAGVNSGQVSRVYDQLVQRQLRTENAGASYATTRAQFAQRLDQLFGQPGSDGALDTVYNKFTQGLQSLAANPGSTTQRSVAVQGAVQLAASLNDLAQNVQDMRTNAEHGIADAVDRANTALTGLENIARQMSVLDGASSGAALEDQRDLYIDELSKILDIRATRQPDGRVTVTTTSGLTLFDGNQAMRFGFDARSVLSASAAYNSNPSLSGVGRLMLSMPGAGSVDVVQQGVLRSGEMKGLLDLRDQVLPEAQRQLDEMAAQLSQAMSDKHPATTAATVGAQTGFDIDLAGIQSGNKVTLDFLQQPGNVPKRVSIIDVRNPSSLPLPLGASGNPNDIVIGVSFAGGVAGALAAIQSGLNAAGTGITVANPSGNVLRVLDDGAANTSDISAVKAGITTTALTNNGAELPLFIDSSTGAPYTGSFDSGSQRTGFSSRIIVNPAIRNDTSKLVQFSTSPATAQGDPTRPNLLVNNLTNTLNDFAADSGIGGNNVSFNGTLSAFVRRVVEDQGAKTAQALSLDQGQQVVVNALQQKFAATAGVNIDQELSQLIQIQNAYAANARIVSAVKDLFDVLMRI